MTDPDDPWHVQRMMRIASIVALMIMIWILVVGLMEILGVGSMGVVR